MPFYEYECPACRYYTEVLQKISDKPLKKCPSCGKAGFRRLISAPVFRLKGSGWYETDFKSDKDNKRNLAGGERDEPKKEADKPADKAADPPKAAAAEPTAAKAPAGRKPAAGTTRKPPTTKRRAAAPRSGKSGSRARGKGRR
jgi:putative FmdB family regulatory protein